MVQYNTLSMHSSFLQNSNSSNFYSRWNPINWNSTHTVIRYHHHFCPFCYNNPNRMCLQVSVLSCTHVLTEINRFKTELKESIHFKFVENFYCSNYFPVGSCMLWRLCKDSVHVHLFLLSKHNLSRNNSLAELFHFTWYISICCWC